MSQKRLSPCGYRDTIVEQREMIKQPNRTPVIGNESRAMLSWAGLVVCSFHGVLPRIVVDSSVQPVLSH